MNAAQFCARRSRIERDNHKRSKRYQVMMAHLVRDAKAALVVRERRIVGYRLPNGQIVCIKKRFATEEKAADVLRLIQSDPTVTGHIPVRIYPCPQCHGYHLTSQERHATA
jgi:hypothetical protein